MFTFEQYAETAEAIRQKTLHRPKIALILGSGLSSLADEVEQPEIIPYDALPHWPQSTVHGHQGRLVIGRLQGQTVAVMQGRVHTYEGYSPQETTLPVRVLRLLGCETLIVTNAAGGLNPTFTAGDLMLITDHINWAGMSGLNPLRGPNIEQFGVRFPDMTFPYTPMLGDVARREATRLGIPLREGVYVFLSGPNFETSAEIRMLHRLGGDAIGMSTVAEVMVARHAGMQVLGISTITNVAHHHPQADHQTTHEEVLEVGKIVVPKLKALLSAVLASTWQ